MGNETQNQPANGSDNQQAPAWMSEPPAWMKEPPEWIKNGPGAVPAQQTPPAQTGNQNPAGNLSAQIAGLPDTIVNALKEAFPAQQTPAQQQPPAQPNGPQTPAQTPAQTPSGDAQQ